MDPEDGRAHFEQLVEKARLRKRLFKEYLTRHQVLERFNAAIEALFEQYHLPEDPFEFIKAHVDGQLNELEGEGPQASFQQPPQPSPSIASVKPAIQVTPEIRGTPAIQGTPKEQERPSLSGSQSSTRRSSLRGQVIECGPSGSKGQKKKAK
ncbi:hypothetical protein DUNSADRAFT_11670 [Dunaliella salina]|uniref:Uncharacterized protein n=1 Tax=Dunaliella salina TaxID=3046 RepID=A0ABQ7GCV2_DUNSA|nr:hypothetical protein DUNSADRAFT_11670 [Dunaliella salina]|eukprot:KAF5832424.1 hypothetical protein DUNSADRAFT_11670 [Dunaliella salina]